METTLDVKGMTCNHCKSSVSGALSALPGVSKVEVDLQSGKVTVSHDGSTAETAMKTAVEEVGFDVV